MCLSAVYDLLSLSFRLSVCGSSELPAAAADDLVWESVRFAAAVHRGEVFDGSGRHCRLAFPRASPTGSCPAARWQTHTSASSDASDRRHYHTLSSTSCFKHNSIHTAVDDFLHYACFFTSCHFVSFSLIYLILFVGY